MADSGSGLTSGNGSLFDLADRRLAYLQHRQQVLAQNVANANTPGYRARDLEPFAAALAGHSSLTPARTDPGHLAGRSDHAGGVIKLTGERSPDGNGVKLDAQLSRVADTETAQATTTNIYSKYLALYRTALGR